MTSAGGPDLTGTEAEKLLRPAAELAIEVAQVAGIQQPAEVPRSLRPLLGHARVTKAAVTTARKVIESDPVFRGRVAASAEIYGGDAAIGRAGVLWLSRPDGWEDELGELVEQARAESAEKDELALERSAQRRLRHAEEARERSDRAAEKAGKSAEAARLDLQEERRLRRAAEEAAAKARVHAASLDEQLASARRRADAVADQVARKAEADGATAALLSARDVAREAVAAASSAALALAAALDRAAAALAPGAELSGAAPSAVGGDPSQLESQLLARPRRGRKQPARRRPAPLPPFVLEDSPEAAEHLVNLPKVTVLVDGYNVTLAAWPHLPLAEQRLRLIDALEELAARTGASPEVVFDGAEVGPYPQPLGAVRSLVKVRFTAADVEADDVLIARASGAPLPVVVASNDRRVRKGARLAGANVLGVDQLLAVLRRRRA
ncbi:MAG: NYN domain-containing protein [Acidimicrobiales bacterium]